MNTVTQEQVDNFIEQTDISTVELVGKKHTVVAVKLRNGFTIIETTTCVDPNNYSEEIGAEIAMDRIKNKIWMLLGFQLQNDLWLNEETKG
jgi:hypothetical protein